MKLRQFSPLEGLADPLRQRAIAKQAARLHDRREQIPGVEVERIGQHAQRLALRLRKIV
ncbi:hypothetical protein [Novosphingobium organovorum]|uniref:hypothetical protein n=1 Tax=Novosphingobium organovorum TaxID=2930092 RepID=UPI001FBB5693|nr:hypothetical protein [Novosphingobium organovorum]